VADPVPEFDAVIIGGGPGGLSALAILAPSGLKVALIDEQPHAGGQIFRNPPASLGSGLRLKGTQGHVGRELLATASAAFCTWLFERTVWGLFPQAGGGFDVMTAGPPGPQRFRAKFVLLAAGAMELPMPFPGWELPGVMGAGAIQTLIKGQRIAAGQRLFLAGSHPLLLILADQLLDLGIKPVGLAFAQSPWRALAGFSDPTAALRGLGKLADGARILARLKWHGVPVHFSTSVTSAAGKGSLESLTLAGPRGTWQVEADALGSCFGFLPNSELGRQAGADAGRDALGGWVLNRNPQLETSVPGLFVAGEGAGVAGADVAMIEGQMAAMSILAAMGTAPLPKSYDCLASRAAGLRQFADLLVRLTMMPNEFHAKRLQGDTLVCRCEDVTAGEIQATLEAFPTSSDPSAIKLATRAGMGLCQGRNCEANVSRLVCAARSTPFPPEKGFTVRAPVKPVPVATLLADPTLGVIDPRQVEQGHPAFDLDRPLARH